MDGTISDADMKVWRFGVIQFDPMLRVDPDGTLHGISSHIIPHLSQTFNISFELKTPTDIGFGSKLADGNWSGIMGLIERDEADMFGVPVGGDHQKVEIVHYSPPLHTSYLLIITALKTEISDNYWGLFATFSLEVWLGVLMSLLFLVLFCVIVDIVLSSAQGETIKISNSLSEHFWNFLASFFSEGTPKQPKRGLNKYLILVWCFSVLTLMNAFTGHFKSQLTIAPIPSQVESVNDLAMESDDLKVMVWKDSSFETLFRKSDHPSLQSITKKAIKNNGFINIREYFTWENYEDTVNGKSAFVVEGSIFMFYLGLMCSIAPETRVHIAKEAVIPFHCFFPYTKRFTKEFQEQIDRRLYQFYETGLKYKWIDDVTDDSDVCTSGVEDVSGEKTLGFKDLRAVFILYFLLMCFSFVIFAFELCMGKP